MFEALEDPLVSSELDQTLQLLQELERNKPEELRKQRMHARHQIAAGLVIRYANSSDRERWELLGTTVDLSESGCQVACAQPLGVGDVYFLEFDRKALDVPGVFARCLRCRLIREDSFEVGFCFFTPVVLPRQLCS